MARAPIVEIDLRGIDSNRALHEQLRDKLQFPEWYGCNWDAFWDAICALVDMPEQLHFLGWSDFEARLPSDASKLAKCLSDMRDEYPELASQVSYA